jgi:predicted DNA binding protein
MSEDDRRDGVPLTPQERAVLLTALDRGYFEVPRRISTVTLAEEVGVSDREVTEHLRRAMAKVLKYGVWGLPSERDE